MCAFYVTHTSRALESHDLSGEGINFRSHRLHTFLTTQGHGGPPRMKDQLSAGATSETTRTLKTIHTIHSRIHSYKADMIWMIMIRLEMFVQETQIQVKHEHGCSSAYGCCRHVTQ